MLARVAAELARAERVRRAERSTKIAPPLLSALLALKALCVTVSGAVV